MEQRFFSIEFVCFKWALHQICLQIFTLWVFLKNSKFGFEITELYIVSMIAQISNSKYELIFKSKDEISVNVHKIKGKSTIMKWVYNNWQT